MEGEEGGGLRLSKRFSDKGGEVDYKTKSGTAWSHNFLNQKPWHPLSYPNQRRKWIAEQTDAQKQRRAEEVAREYSQEQEFYRQTSLISKKEKEKVELMQAVSFMYVRPPGYNAESAKAAEIADEKKNEEQDYLSQDQIADGSSSAMQPESLPGNDHLGDGKKKPRPKDVFGRRLPTEEEFEVLKNAPRLETGAPARVKPFAVEVRNVKCLRCGKYGHQSGDRECPLKDAIMPNEESRLKRDDPLNAIIAHTDPNEPLKWELKQKPGISPPRGGFNLDDPNQQIVAEDIFDEYGGFLSGGNVPELLMNFSRKPTKKSTKKIKHKQKPSSNRELTHAEDGPSDDDGKRRSKKTTIKVKKKKRNRSESSSSDTSESNKHSRKSGHKHSYLSEDSHSDRDDASKSRRKYSHSSEDFDPDRHHRSKKNSRRKYSYSFEGFDHDGYHRNTKSRHKFSYSSDDSESDRQHRTKRSSQKQCCASEDSDPVRHHRSKNSRGKHSDSSEDSDHDEYHRSSRHNRTYLSEDSHSDRQHRTKRSSQRHSYSSVGRDSRRHRRNDRSKYKNSHSHSSEEPVPKGHGRSKHHHSHRGHRRSDSE
ncbi:CBF1-interacting co-repressor CIR, N-terminal domain containing protein [Quillaja saponaria]|uniref:CBF1-interacting co-repressor CIR, N-terminal domain containing protein n=1 Tax=Quillaja saponaria TaxID=32244 RepID=A0AAD7KRP5_QUISA|nr:CBF1-interacting co-repressor CIR, N-terminal domain containing protein [Quillaja saponaria]